MLAPPTGQRRSVPHCIVRLEAAEYTRCRAVSENFLQVPKLPIMETKMQIDTTKSEEVIRKHKEYIWPAVANFYERPLVADRARMQYVWDLEGRKYLDFFGGILTISVGHTNPKVTSKIKAQVDRLQHMSTLYPTEPIVALAEKVAQI